MNSFAVLFGLFGPFLVWPIEHLLPYPFFIEEIFKAAVVYFCLQNKIKLGQGLKTFASAGIAFAFTETVFYSLAINLLGRLDLFFIRFIATAILHSTTFMVIYLFGATKKWMILYGVLISILIHYIYNRFIPPLL